MTRAASLRPCALLACAQGLLGLLACAEPRALPASERAQVAAAVATPRAQAAVFAIRVVSIEDDVPSGGDGAPRMTLAFELTDGTEVAIEGQATAYARFRDGVALVDRDERLLLVTPDGARRVLARQAGAPPVQGPSGELAYVAKYDLVAEVHVLEANGRDRVVASGLADAGMLAPQPGGVLVFVGARAGGVAGVWRASADGEPARCMTNCELRTGTEWGDRHVPLPQSPEALLLQAELPAAAATTVADPTTEGTEGATR